MDTSLLETDYLIVGAGAMGLAFADTLLQESDARMLIVDRRHGPGGHWNDAYPFVRLHQPSAFYGVESRPLASASALCSVCSSSRAKDGILNYSWRARAEATARVSTLRSRSKARCGRQAPQRIPHHDGRWPSAARRSWIPAVRPPGKRGSVTLRHRLSPAVP